MEFLRIKFKIVFLTCFLFLLFFGIVGCKSEGFKKWQGLSAEELSWQGLSCLLYENKTAVKSGERKLIVLFHPAGSSGSDYVERWEPLLKEIAALVIAPTADQEHPYSSPQFETKFLQLVQDVSSRYKIDVSSKYLIGESNGAIYGYRFLASHPNFFKAAVLISGALDQQTVTQFEKNPAVSQAAILIVHGTEDQVFRIDITRKEVEYLKKLGFRVDFKEIKGMGHGADIFAEDEIVEWIKSFSQSSKASKFN